MPPVGIDEQGLAGMLNIFPNPAENNLFIEIRGKNSLSLQLTVSDLVGKTVVAKIIQLNPGNKSIPIDVSDLQDGVYILRIADNERIFTKKIIIKR